MLGIALATSVIRFEAWLETLPEDNPPCSNNILCEKRNWHKCEYRPVAISAYWKGMRNA